MKEVLQETDFDGAARMFLRAGPVSLLLDVDSLFIRRLSVGGTEILRGIYPALRDENWGTYKPEVTVVELVRNPDSFQIHLNASFEAPFQWDALIEGDAAGRVHFKITGMAQDTLTTSRAGFCVLHPASVAGFPCTISHSDGSVEETKFPREISSTQPFFKVSAITHEPAPGLRVKVGMSGEVFESEDQRNWTDASFKTYCRPLSKPFPYTLEKGHTFTQEVQVKVDGPTQSHGVGTPASGLLLAAPDTFVKPPQLGFSRDHAHPLRGDALRFIKAAAPKHLFANCHGSVEEQVQQLESALVDARNLGCRIIAVIDVVDGEQAKELAEAFGDVEGVEAVDWLPMDPKVHETRETTFTATMAAWSSRGLPGKVGAGVSGNFAEFNRLQPAWDGIAFVACAMSPQVHAFDRLSMVETLAVQPLVVRSMRAVSNAPAYASPVSLLQLWNPVATTEAEAPGPDPRLHKPFGAAWTLGSIAALTEGGADTITMHAATGPHGIFPRAGDSSLPRLFQTLAGLTDGEWGILHDTQEGVPCGLMIRHKGGLTALLANLSNRSRALNISPELGEPISRELLCAVTGDEVSQDQLLPWSVTRFDFEG